MRKRRDKGKMGVFGWLLQFAGLGVESGGVSPKKKRK